MSETPSEEKAAKLITSSGTGQSMVTLIIKGRTDTLSGLLAEITKIHKKLVEMHSSNDVDQKDLDKLVGLLPDRKYEPEYTTSAELFYSKIEDELPSVNQEISLAQTDECFDSSAVQSVKIRLIRNFKALARTIQRIPFFVVNKFIGTGKGKRRDYPDWNHTVHPGRVARYAIYKVSRLPESWIHSDRRYYRELVQIYEELFRHLFESLDISDIGSNKAAGREALQSAADSVKSLRNKVRLALQNVESECVVFSDQISEAVQETAAIAGTLEFPHHRYSGKRLQKSRQAAVQRMSSHYEEWHRDYNALADRVLALKSLYGFSVNLISSAGKLHANIDSLYSKSIKVPVEKIFASFMVIHREFDEKSIKGNKKSVSSAIGVLNRKLKDVVINPLEKLLSGLTEKDELFNGSEVFIREVVEATVKLPGNIDLIENCDDERVPPKTVTEQIDLRRAIDAFVRSDIIRDIKPVSSRIETYLARKNRELAELGSITDVNLSMATDALDDPDAEHSSEEALKLIIESLDRIENRIESTITSIVTENEECTDIVNVHTREAIQYLRDLIHNKELIRLKWKTRELEARSTAIGWKEGLISKSQFYGRKAELILKITGKKASVFWNSLRGFLGYRVQVDETIKTDVANYLAETERRIAELPLIYRKLYSFEPLQDKRYLTGRNIALLRFEKSWLNWNRGLFSNTVFVGERGSGKTTMIHMSEEMTDPTIERLIIRMNHTISEVSYLLNELCKTLSLEPVNSTTEFINSVNDMPEKKIVVLEGFQNLYLRNINGFDAIESFLLILSRTSEKIYWIVTSSRYAWSYLDKVLNVAEYFTDIIYCDRLSNQDIRELIQNRHAMSGYDLVFEPGTQDLHSRAYKKLEGNTQLQQEYLSERYFENLAEIAEGNASIAIIYWLRSVARTDTSRIYISPLEEKRVQLSADLTEDALFTLAAILMHDDLTVEQLAGVLNMSHPRCRLLLSRMKSRSILTEHENRYYLNNMLYRHATRIVTGKNILH